MFTPIVRHVVFFTFCSLTVLGQQQSSPVPGSVREFPMLLESNVIAGKTAEGTKIQAKLCVATLVDGTVIPRNAVFSGEVIESVTKTATDPSRLAIRMDSAQWKNGSASVKAYLTAWYYPSMTEAGQSLQYGPTQPANRTWNGEGQYPDPNSKIYRPFPGSGSDQSSGVPDATTSVTSNHRVAMKNVESEQSSDGTITIVSKKSNIKLDRLTMYVLATGDIPQPSAKPEAAK
jgi:hypothetical protein